MDNQENLSPSDYPLPIINDLSHTSMLGDAEESRTTELMNLAEAKILVNNPELYKIMIKFIESLELPDGLSKKASLYTFIMTHELLRKQAEADNINSIFNL